MKIKLLKYKLSKILINIAYKLDPSADEYKQYVMDKVINQAVMGGLIKIEWVPPDKVLVDNQ